VSDLSRLPPRSERGYHVVVESPRGSLVKLKFEPSLEAFALSRPLPAGLAFPYDFGFVPSTHGEDGDPVDAFVVWDVPCFPGVVIECRLIGVIEVEQNAKRGGRERNDRLLAVPIAATRERFEDVRELPKRLRDEIANFIVAVTALEAKDAQVLGLRGAAAARALVRSASATGWREAA
jgi:inorganic pyrophosphatase